MSVKLLSFAFSLDISPAEKLVLLSICDCSNDDGLCWPSLEKLSQKCSMSLDGVSRIIRWLESSNILKRKKRFGRSTVYTVNISYQFRSPVENDPESNQFRPGVESIFDPESKEIYEPSMNRNKKRKYIRKERANGKTGYPEGFEPDIEAINRCAKLGLDLDEEARKFRDWTTAGGYRYADWQAAFRNHLNRASEKRGERESGERARRQDVRDVTGAALRAAASLREKRLS